ncbi:carbohydrate ABC transporter permease [Cohnella nanjingensis]|uniref:Carbohydrate ABC transporter permease n=1 Tax=Cohnella nanjingensis TaxID=1387779 RepID=A0A7X0RNS9_9BACL|nr:carbohydrate ABC transporter permease [Cohnella nanjingensis]MBB6670761.1 carbohydrate ABC transporter permease [Cohnella nanjingensis]
MKRNNIVIHLILAGFALICLLPFVLIVSTSLMHEKDIALFGYSFIPKRFTLMAYEVILKNPQQLINSYAVTIAVTLIGTAVGLWLTATIAYVMTRKDYKYRNKISFYVFFTMLFNGGLVPSYILISRWLGMKNTIFALFVPYLVNAWFVLLMKGFLQSIPHSLVESAKIDGAGEFKIFVKIILPIAKPAIATVGLFMVLQYWNDWWLSMLFIDKENLYTLQYLLIRVMRNLEFLNTEFARKYLNLAQVEIPTLSARMAMSVLAAGPMLFVFPFFQKYFVKGLTVGSVKG